MAGQGGGRAYLGTPFSFEEKESLGTPFPFEEEDLHVGPQLGRRGVHVARKFPRRFSSCPSGIVHSPSRRWRSFPSALLVLRIEDSLVVWF